MPIRQLQGKEIKRFHRENKVARNFEVVLLLENIQYARNVASMFRIADAAGIKKMYLTGISKQPPFGKQLKNVSRSKERSVQWSYVEHSGRIIQTLKKQGYRIVALEIARPSKPIETFAKHIKSGEKICLIVGNETYGITKKTLEKCDEATFIPMYGVGASLNVSMSAAVALFAMY